MSAVFGTNSMVDLLVKIANDTEEPDVVRIAAAEGLGYVESQHGRVQARKALTDLIEGSSKISSVRAAAAKSLGRLA